jgi:DNA-binding transcriptional ArsR family regulator
VDGNDSPPVPRSFHFDVDDDEWQVRLAAEPDLPLLQLTLTQAVAYIQPVDAALRAVAEPRRREILRLVWSEELPATEIAERVGQISRSAVSQHLTVLKRANLVVERREGTRRLYRSNHEEMARLRTFLDDYWTTGLDQLRRVAEAEQRSRSGHATIEGDTHG